ncbi:MAG: FHIPEP family type III secretion protein, partial [Perlucidibaca sp.]
MNQTQASGGWQATLHDLSRNGLGILLLIMALLGMLVLPLPAFLLDLFFTFNITLSLVILFAVIYVQRPMDFSAFPTVLLLATLLRLSLNVASTRVVLLEGHQGPGAAGKVIESFGHFIIGGNFAVGIVVFIILVIINFMVVTKGAGRVSEVTARFTLDAMPGKQMAIDADLNAGLLTEAEARTRRTEIAREADFFGAMDGASKFVKGDAAAGLIITAVNLIGGLAVGMTSLGLTATEALDRFAMLTIGDGLVSQIPALLISIAAGIAVTRSSATEDDLGSAVVEEFSRQKRAFQLYGVALAALGALPGLPFIPFALVGGILIALSVRLKTTEAVETVAEEDEPAPDLD